jgi:cephalosporin-C deacetylase-like acetyl esterase
MKKVNPCYLPISPTHTTAIMKPRLQLFAFCLSLWMHGVASNAQDLTCLKSEVGGTNQPVTWYELLQKEARTSLDLRTEKLEQLKTPDQIRERQIALRKFMVQQLGGFPQRNPLNGQVLGQLIRKGYRIEKVIFESQPMHHVTGNLYIPDGKGPFPGVIVSSGHSRTAKTAEYNQRFGIILAQHGMVALCYDPIGQGERSQILTSEGKPKFSGTTVEHHMLGTGSILVGKNTATYRIWDAMRAIDYLETREEVDPQRIGMTGCSGGGTLTSYVMALDDRVACAAPACYLTTFRHLIDTIGPQDAEQNIFGQVAFGLDHPDYVLMRAPKPTLISSTTGDFFAIAGSWENFRQSKRVFARLGASERIDLVEAEGVHGVQPASLAAIAQWMQRWLLGHDKAVPIVDFKDFDIRPESDLICTEKGQVLLLPGERSVFELNAEIEKGLAPQREKQWQSANREQQFEMVRKVAGIRPLAELSVPTSNKAGKVQRDGYHIDKLVIHHGTGVPMPALTFHPVEPEESAYLYVHDGGKEADSAVGGPIEKLVRAGYVVVSVDLRGQGETAHGKPDPLLGDWKTYSLAYLLGQSVVGGHAEDILIAGKWAADYKSQKPREVHLVATGQSGIAALHAAALNPGMFATITLQDTPPSWSAMAGSVENAKRFTATVHGALKVYDLPDLIRLLPVPPRAP